jgi:hypothetical protein
VIGRGWMGYSWAPKKFSKKKKKSLVRVFLRMAGQQVNQDPGSQTGQNSDIGRQMTMKMYNKTV